ncbi:MAG: hypothetical protein EON61_05730 [Alphaproteobacteria bacterium]|jgi:hypothetical protein|nr:MAG: hypothetical protein EON61_05730 [Alphaproteobacteria bacterium]
MDMSGPDWVMIHQTSGRRDFRLYAVLAVGLVFVFAGSTIAPASNCSESGECAPWLVPVAFWLGALASLSGAVGLIRNPRRGSRINVRTGELMWWNEVHPSASGSLNLADVSIIRVDASSDSSTVVLLDGKGGLMPFGGVEVVPWRLEAWARGVARLQPHIRVELA